MPLQNRVTPLGELIATPERGLVYGNRGRLHDEHGSHPPRPWQLRRWISCRLEFRGRYRAGGPMAPDRYTGLFFLDEATALAAGHRPCAECRNADYRSFLALTGATRARRARRAAPRRARTRPRAELTELPDGTFVVLDGEPWLVLGSDLLRWAPGGYSERRPRRGGAADVVTPPTSVRVLASGWRGSLPLVHPNRPAVKSS